MEEDGALSELMCSNTYPIDTESGAEMARLIDQSQLMQRVLFGLLPESLELPCGAQVLDLACGPGHWATELARHEPDMDVIGIDCSQAMICYARAYASVQRIGNVSFCQMDIKEPLAFPENSVDLVHGRFLAGVLDQTCWQTVIGEYFRVLKPGGVLLLTECEGALTNSAALHQLQGALFHAFHQEQRTFSLDGQSLGITHMLGRWLEHVGLMCREQEAFVLDSSGGSRSFPAMQRNMQLLFMFLKPYLLNMGDMEEGCFDSLYERMIEDMLQEEYICQHFGLRAWGTKPGLCDFPPLAGR